MKLSTKLVKAKKISQELLDDIVEYEDQAQAAAANGTYHADLHSLITVARKSALLTPAVERRLYFHLLRKGEIPVPRDGAALAVLAGAYHDLMADAQRSNAKPAIERLAGMLLFGYWMNVRLDGGDVPDFARFQHWQAVLKQCGKYSHIPGMLAKPEKFAPFADDATATRILAALEALGFQHSDIAPDYPDNYSYTNLEFWALVDIVLLNEHTRMLIVHAFLARLPALPLVENQLEILERFVSATGDESARALFQSLQAQVLNVLPPREESADEATVRELVTALGISVPDKHWNIGFILSTVPMENWFYRRNKLTGTDIQLQIFLGDSGRWKVLLERHDNMFFIRWDGNHAQAWVDAEQLTYRRMVNWPSLDSLQEVARLIEKIEAALDIRFIRHADVSSDAGMNSKALVKTHGAAIQQWLAPYAQTLGTGMQTPASN